MLRGLCCALRGLSYALRGFFRVQTVVRPGAGQGEGFSGGDAIPLAHSRVPQEEGTYNNESMRLPFHRPDGW